MKPLKRGARVTAGTVLGRIGRVSTRTGAAPAASRSGPPAAAPRGSTRSRSSTAGSCSSRPRSTARRAATRSSARTRQTPSIGQILLMSKEALAAARARRPERSQIYDCGRQDIHAGQIDRRVLATLEFLVASGPQADGHLAAAAATRYLTASGNVSEHTTGTAVDIAAINGIPILGHQGEGSITELDDPAPADAAGHDEAAPDHLADDVRGRRQHARDGRPRRPHPRRLPAAVRRQREGCASRSTRCSSRSSGSS